MKEKNKSKIYMIIAAASLFVYLFVIITYPAVARLLQVIYVFFLLCAASYYDILMNGIPVFLCVGVLLVNIFYSALCGWDYRGWLAGAVVILILLAILVINKKAIGLGDILIIGFLIPALTLSDLFLFLFLTFLLSSVFGLIKGIKIRKFTGTTVPLAPCIAISFIIAASVSIL